jgi:hypothetical protein
MVSDGSIKFIVRLLSSYMVLNFPISQMCTSCAGIVI